MAKHTTRNLTAEEVVQKKIEDYALKKGVPIEAVKHSRIWGCYLDKKYFKRQAARKRARKRKDPGQF